MEQPEDRPVRWVHTPAQPKRMNGANSFAVPNSAATPPATTSEGSFLPEFEHEPNQQDWNPIWGPCLGAYDVGSSCDEPSYNMNSTVSQQDLYALNEFLIPAKAAAEHQASSKANTVLREPYAIEVFMRVFYFKENVLVSTNMPSRNVPTKDVSQTRKAPVVLSVIRQPEQQHRARYLSEGSRGAIKDRSGSSHCTIQLTGYYRPTRVEMYAGSGTGLISAHPLYQLIPVSGKAANTTPCKAITSTEGINCLEIVLRPESNMSAVLDCVGILKICTYDVKQRRLTKNASNCSVRIVFRAFIVDPNGGPDIVVQTESEPIRCVQQLGVPEVFKMSLNSSSARGGCDLFIIGRNFDRNTTVLFREYKEDGTLAWSAEAPIDKQYLHQCHIVCTVPTYHCLRRGGTVSVTVKCGSKLSHPTTFHFTPNPEDDDWRPPESPKYEVPSYERAYESCYTSLNYGSVGSSSGLFQHDEDEGPSLAKRVKLGDETGLYY
uniref:RHD domain-containing protein n=1 Tax=Steinernema glaseri TaxID=37863 RepID=A0A1I8AK48_9BILA